MHSSHAQDPLAQDLLGQDLSSGFSGWGGVTDEEPPFDMPSAPVNPEESASVIQAALRGHKSRADASMRESWLSQLAQGALAPVDLGELPNGRQSVPDALLGAKGRTAAIAATKQKAAAEKKKTDATTRQPKARLPSAARRPSAMAAGTAPKPSGIKDPEWRKANKDFIKSMILMPCIDKACKLGEAMLAARSRQAAFETRELQKPVCVGSLFGTSGVSGDAHSTVSVIEQDGLAVVCSRSELLQLSMHTAPLPELGLSPLVRQTAQQAAELPSTAKLHSLTVDAASARIFAMHVDGTMLVWGGRHGELRHSAQLLPPTAMAAAPTTSLIRVDEESQLLLFDCTWHDGTVRVLEPLSLDVLAQIGAAMPGEPPGTRRVAHMLYIEPVQLVLCSFEGVSSVIGYDGGSGECKLHLEGHSGSSPMLKWLLRPQRLATLGTGAPPFGDPEYGGDCTIRLWKLTTVAPRRDSGPGSVSGIDAVCERVLHGHTGPLTDVAFLPEANLLVSCAHDRTIRFWDAEASPHPLTAPEGGAHVRVGPGRYETMRPEWTVTNPPYVNCLVVQTQDTPISLAAVTGWRGPEGLLVLTAHTTPRRGAALLGPPSSALPAAGGTLALWAVTRAFTSVEARRFDEVLTKKVYSDIEATAARDWRHALQRLREAEAGFGEVRRTGVRLQRAQFARFTPFSVFAAACCVPAFPITLPGLSLHPTPRARAAGLPRGASQLRQGTQPRDGAASCGIAGACVALFST